MASAGQVPAPTVSAGDRATALSVEATARMVDLKGIYELLHLSGAVESWSDFRFKFEGACSLLGLEDSMNQALQVTDESRFDDMIGSILAQSKLLWN